MDFLRKQPLLLVCFAACCGITADRTVEIGQLGWQGTCLLLFLWCGLFVARSNLSSCCLLLAVISAMASWHHHQWSLLPPHHIALQLSVNGEPKQAALRGRIVDLPESGRLPDPDTPQASLSTLPRGVRSTFRFAVSHIRDRQRWVPAIGSVATRVEGHLLGLSPGDDVQIFGSLSRPAGPMNPGQSSRGAADRVLGVLCRLDVPHPDCVTRFSKLPPGWRVQSWLGRLRLNGLWALDHFVGAPRDVLAGALLLGARERLEQERIEGFFQTGTIHLLAISGLHLGILTWCFFFLAKNSPLRRSILIALMAFSLGYCFLTGSRDPVLRAAALVVIVCVGMMRRRRIMAYNALAAAAILVLVLRPGALFQPGTQLSFLAVSAIIWLGLNHEAAGSTAIESLISRTRPWYQRTANQAASWGWHLAYVGALIWLVTLPLVMLHFHLVSPIALILNVILAVPIVVSLLSGFLVMLAGQMSTWAGIVCGRVCECGLAFVEETVKYAHDLPGAYFWTAGPTQLWCVAFYAGLGIIVMIPRYRVARLWGATWILVWLTAPVVYGFLADSLYRKTELRCTFLSVGHGTCVVLELPTDQVLLYDCGRMGIPEAGVRIVSEFLWHRRISHIDGVILSHADADHYNLLPGLLQRFEVGEVFVSEVMFDHKSAGTSVLRQAITDAGIPIRRLQTDDYLQSASPSEATIQVLHPLPSATAGSDNANSVVVELRYQGRTILLPGDLESPGLDDVLSESPRDCNVLMAPHHGSLNRKSSPEQFAAWCSPEFVVISGGLDPDMLGKQKAAFSNNGCEVLHTSEVGAVTVRICDGQLSIESFLDVEGDPLETTN